MFKNYFKTAIRNLLRYKGFSFINILSLAIGIIGCIVIGLFVWDEKQYDTTITGGEHIYRIYDERKEPSATTYMAVTSPAYATFLQKQFPEVDTTARIMMIGDKYLLEYGEKKNYEEKGIYVDASFLKVFSLPLTSGNPATALATPNSIVLTKELATKYFGNEDAVGKIIKIDTVSFTVNGVLAKLPEHFHLNFRYLISLSSADWISPERMENWTWSQFYNYVKLKPGANVKQLQGKFQAHIKKEIHPTLEHEGSSFLPFFQPLKDIHLHSSDFVYDNAVRGNATYVKGLTIIAMFVLIIACFNFINLATARSFRRAKEIGVRKVIGADRKQLIVQFIGETVLLAVIAVFIATIACLFIIPILNEFTGKSISFSFLTNPMLAVLLLASAIVIGILAGIYPAMVLSGFQPIKVLKSMKIAGGSNTGWLRQALVVVQFALSALLIISTTIVYRQIKFLNNKDLGFNKEQVIYFQARGNVASSVETFKSELLRSPNILSVTSGYGLPGDQFAGDGVTVPGPNGEKKYSTNVFLGDHDYVKTLGLKVIAGRDFSKEMKTDVEEAFIINQTAVKELGFGTPEYALGKALHWEKWGNDSLNPLKKGKIIGVVQDFHYKSLHEKVIASVIQIYPQELYKVAVKLKTADVQQTVAYINSVWNKFSPEYPLDYQFMDETYGKMYKSEEKLSALLWIFTIMAIVVGCMGLFALAAFSAEQRTKEIGIRKVLGASVFHIIGLLSKNFILLVLIASIIAFPIAWWAMHNWLEDFPYRINISWWVFGIAAIVAVAIAFITVSFQSIKAATSNPVKSLRTE